MAFPTIPRDEVFRAVESALSVWDRACGVRFERVGPLQRANIEMGAEAMASESNIAAYSGVACNARPTESIQQVYNTRNITDAITLRKVVIHEVGHALGLGHSSTSDDIMFASVTDRDTLGLGDLAEITARYGAADEPAPVPTPVPRPAPPRPAPPIPPLQPDPQVYDVGEMNVSGLSLDRRLLTAQARGDTFVLHWRLAKPRTLTVRSAGPVGRMSLYGRLPFNDQSLLITKLTSPIRHRCPEGRAYLTVTASGPGPISLTAIKE